jgi:hypothetical protein
LFLVDLMDEFVDDGGVLGLAVFLGVVACVGVTPTPG